jgi:hypothetical protein
MRLVGCIPRYGKGGNDIFNCTKGKVLLTLVTNQDKWPTVVQLAETTGLNANSLSVLLKRWNRSDWHIIQRRMHNGFMPCPKMGRPTSFLYMWYTYFPF